MNSCTGALFSRRFDVFLLQAPEIMSTTQRYVPQLDPDHLSNHNTYYFITEVIIRAFKSGYTGEYACRMIADYKVQAGVYLYFADPTALFLPTPSEKIGRAHV